MEVRITNTNEYTNSYIRIQIHNSYERSDKKNRLPSGKRVGVKVQLGCATTGLGFFCIVPEWHKLFAVPNEQSSFTLSAALALGAAHQEVPASLDGSHDAHPRNPLLPLFRQVDSVAYQDGLAATAAAGILEQQRLEKACGALVRDPGQLLKHVLARVKEDEVAQRSKLSRYLDYEALAVWLHVFRTADDEKVIHAMATWVFHHSFLVVAASLQDRQHALVVVVVQPIQTRKADVIDNISPEIAFAHTHLFVQG